jgi:hypothetical protein
VGADLWTVFEVELMEIMGVKPETPVETAKPTPAMPSHVVVQPASDAVPVGAPTSSVVAQTSPLDEEKGNGECNLLGDFALIVQGLLGLLAVSSLAVKRWREHPRRPVKIWFFDASKQVFGSVLLHLANVLMSMLSSGKFDVALTTVAASSNGDQPNPCSFYLLNLAIDVSPIPSSHVTITNNHRQQSASPFLFSSSKSSTAAPFSPPSPIPPSPSAPATTVFPRAQHGGSSNPSSTSSASYS